MTPQDIDDIKTVLQEQFDILQRLGKIPLPLGSIPDDKYQEIITLYNSIIECNKIMKEIVDGPVGGIEKLVERTKSLDNCYVDEFGVIQCDGKKNESNSY
jgi:hypothetical protein